MKGTDLHDQRACYYRFQHKSRNWVHRIITHFLMTAAVNAYLVFCRHRGESISFISFLHDLMYELAGEKNQTYHDDEVNNSSDTCSSLSDEDNVEETSKHRRASTWKRDSSRLVVSHTPQIVPGARLRCMTGCQQRVQTKCVECNAYLCCKGTGTDSCWFRFHNQQDFGKSQVDFTATHQL